MSFARTNDGRGAYLALNAHYLGDATQGRIRTHADNLLSRTYFDGKSRNFTFEKYCEVLNRAIQDLADTGEQVPMDRQVRILLNGIRDPRLQSAGNTILSAQSLRGDFDAAINHMAQVLDMHTSYKTQSNNSNRQISSVAQGQSQGRGQGGR